MQYATYCPEDNKLRLYVGRVPRDEYERLRREGWTSTPKQDCDFVATWTPTRRDTALEYGGGVIEDEDQPPADRAADRAERFGGYRDKRLGEATGHADRYDAQPSAHGFQNQQRAERAAARHDRIATRATDAWSKAEYWTRRTAGVIQNALYKSLPGVRMGRIKEIEADLRRIEASHAKAHAERSAKHAALLAIVEHAEGRREKLLGVPGWQYSIAGIRRADNLTDDAPFTAEQKRRCMISAIFAGEYSGRWHDLRDQAQAGTVEAAAVAREWLDAHGWEPPKPADMAQNDWHCHLTLRLAYENQMLAAQGGRAAHVEMEVGGFLRGGRRLGGGEERRIIKVNKSPKTGRVVSVLVRDNQPSLRNHWGNEFPDGKARILCHTVETERLSPDAYRPPTEEERRAFLAELEAEKKQAKANAAPTIPLINPTDEDAERLQALWNAQALAEREASYKRMGYRLPVTDCEPQTVLRMTQASYSAHSKGTYAPCGTRAVFTGGIMCDSYYNALQKMREKHGREVCQVRRTSGGTYNASRVIVLTDKPQKPLPAAVWEKPFALEAETVAA